MENYRYFQVAGITIKLESDLDFNQIQFKPALLPFQIDSPGDENVRIRHHFFNPNIEASKLGKTVYHRTPLIISKDRTNGHWHYYGITPEVFANDFYWHAIFNEDYSSGTIYNSPNIKSFISQRYWPSLTLFSTDQVWLAPLMLERQGILLHSSAAIVNDCGFVFIGHSEAGKTTTMRMLKASQKFQEKILCDDRNIIRLSKDGWHVHGTWSHGDEPEVSPGPGKIKALMFLQQDNHNQLEKISDTKTIINNLLGTWIRGMMTKPAWDEGLRLITKISSEIPCYTMHFTKDGNIINQLLELST